MKVSELTTEELLNSVGKIEKVDEKPELRKRVEIFIKTNNLTNGNIFNSTEVLYRKFIIMDTTTERLSKIEFGRQMKKIFSYKRTRKQRGFMLNKALCEQT